jgi:predicted NBD/HSP70 family sugar kinase
VSEGDTAMADVVRRFSKRIAIFIFNLNTLLDLDKVAIGGGISRQAILLEMIREETEKLYTHPMYTGLFPAARAPEIVQCRYFNDSNMVGAMYHFLIRERHEEAL